MWVLFASVFIASADARSCIDHAYEHMEVERVSVESGGKTVDAPPELHPLNEVLNSGYGGKGLLFWEKETMGFSKFYLLDRVSTPDVSVQSYLTSTAARTLETSCGYDVQYTPILPGEYPFAEEHLTGAKTSAGIDHPRVVVAPDRKQVELFFGVGPTEYRAVYRVTCAYFDWETRGVKRCSLQ